MCVSLIIRITKVLSRLHPKFLFYNFNYSLQKNSYIVTKLFVTIKHNSSQ